MANYSLSPEAEEDLYRIWLYGFRKFGEKQADKYYKAFFVHFEMIAKDPYLFPPVDYIRFGYRRCVSGVDSIYYKIIDDTIEIMTIIGRQDVDAKF